jgi:hypothetical protein
MNRIVYVLKERDTTFYRVGSSSSFDYRKKLLKQGNPRVLEELYVEVFETEEIAILAEKRIHSEFSKYHFRDSWYNIPPKKETDIGYELKKIRMETEKNLMESNHNKELEKYLEKENKRIQDQTYHELKYF